MSDELRAFESALTVKTADDQRELFLKDTFEYAVDKARKILRGQKPSEMQGDVQPAVLKIVRESAAQMIRIDRELLGDDLKEHERSIVGMVSEWLETRKMVPSRWRPVDDRNHILTDVFESALKEAKRHKSPGATLVHELVRDAGRKYLDRLSKEMADLGRRHERQIVEMTLERLETGKPVRPRWASGKKAVAPPGWEDTVKKMKKHDEIDNPWALAWSMKNKGYTPGGKDKEAEEFEDAVLARKVATRMAAQQVWLPDLLGAKEGLVKKAWTTIKNQTRGEMYSDPKSAAGGVVYFTLNAAGGRPLGQKLWGLLDNSAGLSADSKWDRVAGQVFTHLRTSDRDLNKVMAAAFGVSLLSLSRQRRKADQANKLLNKVLESEIAEAVAVTAAPGESAAKETPDTVFQEYMDAEVVGLARGVAQQIDKDFAKAGDIILALMGDVNYRGGIDAASGVVPTGDGVPHSIVSDISSKLEWSIQPSAAFSVALLQAIGQTANARKLQRAFIKSDPDMYDPSEF